MKTENSTGPLPGWIARWPKLPLAVIGMIALLATSCRSPDTMTTSRQWTDTLQNVKKTVLTLLPVAASQVQTKYRMSQLTALPQGAGYSERNGRATSKVTRGQGDTLIVTSTCDSLEREVYALREELTRIRSDTELKIETPPLAVKHEPNGWQWFWIRMGQTAIGILLLLGGYRLIKQYYAKKKREEIS